MKKTLLATLLLLPTLAFAQTKESVALFDKADWPKDKIIDCKSAPKDAVTKVPKELEAFARVVCTKTGHHFMAKRGWHWHHQTDGLPPFFVSAAAASAVELAYAHGRVHVITPDIAQIQTGHGNVMPQTLHGGPGRAGGGEELGGKRGLGFYHRRSGLQIGNLVSDFFKA